MTIIMLNTTTTRKDSHHKFDWDQSAFELVRVFCSNLLQTQIRGLYPCRVKSS